MTNVITKEVLKKWRAREKITMTTKPSDTLDRIIQYEQGDLDDEAILELFQDLVSSGLAWQLQGHYGRTARSLIENDYIEMPANK